AQPGAERPCLGRLLPFTAVQMHRQPHDDPADLLLLDDLAIIALVLLPVAPGVRRQREGDLALGVADGQADAYAAVIDPQDPRPPRHRYFSSPFFLSSSTSCFTVPSSRRSATRVASPSWTMSRLLTPTVAIRCPASAAMTQPCVFRPQCWPRTVLPS